MTTDQQVSNFNIANVLTVLRIAMVPLFGWALLHDGGDDPTWRWVAFALFAVAMITDKIDGDLARKHNLITDFGKIADPIADKAITGMAFIGLSLVGDIWWWVTIVVLLREWSVTLLRLSVLKDGRHPGREERQDQDRPAGDRPVRTDLAAAARRRPRRSLRLLAGPAGRGALLRRPGPPRRCCRDDDLVGLEFFREVRKQRTRTQG